MKEVQKRFLKKFLFILLGFVLLGSILATGSYGLSKHNTDIYDEALALQPQVDDIGFLDFRLSDYPVAFFDGEDDYVLNWKNGEYSISKRKPALTVLAATIHRVDNQVEILVPTMEQMSAIGSISKTMSSFEAAKKGNEKNIETEFDITEQVMTLWHEAFHAYQFSRYRESVETIHTEDIDETIALSEIDNNTAAVILFQQEMELLKNALLTADVDKMREYVIKYRKIEKKREKLFTKSILDLEEYYTRVEGSAQYISACIFKYQMPEQFRKVYIENVDFYREGTIKYYNMGMMQCLLLDKLNPDWKVGYDFSTSFMELVYDELEIR